MARETFLERNFAPASRAVIDAACAIIAEYQRAGFTLTLRQLYYQFVARELLPNKQRSYDRLGSIVNAARLAGLIDWDAIEDRTRNLRRHKTYGSPGAALTELAGRYQENPWRRQGCRPEVWIEKDALLGVVERACDIYRVPYFACRGYTSQSEQYAAGKRFARYIRHGLMPVVIHLGDHDPSGIDMTRDNRDRLAMFARGPVRVRRIALTRAQVERYRLPPNPAKATDSRFADYAREHGRASWELDALAPQVINDLVVRAIESLIDDRAAWREAARREKGHRAQIEAVAAKMGESR